MFYMITHYTYDGEFTHDEYPVIPFQEYDEAKDWLWTFFQNNIDYEWESNSDDTIINVVRRQGRYAWDSYSISEMEFGKEIG